MKFWYVPFVAVAMSGCVTSEAEMTDKMAFSRISDEAAFKASVADRRLEWPDNPDVWFQLNSDGSMVGNLRKGTVTGSWTFEGGYWCREFSAGGKPSPHDCQTVDVNASQARFTRDRGNGDAGVYSIK